MSKEINGTVVEKTYHTPPGAPDKYWCYLVVAAESGERVNIRLHQKIHDQILVGDQINFEKPWRKNKRVKDVHVTSKRPSH